MFAASTIRLIQWIFVFSSFCLFANQSIYHMGQLSNELTYYICHNPTFRKHISLDLVVQVGSLNEQEDERGFSHLIEHFVASEMKFKGVKIEDDFCPLWDLSNPEAYELTSYEFTQYHLDISRAISHGLEEGLKSFSSMLTTFQITQQNFREHQQDILDEIAETDRSPLKKWQQIRIDHEYPPYRDKHPIGNASCIQEATAEKVNHFFHRHYQPSRSAIIVVGNIDVELVEELIRRYFKNLTNTSDVARPPQIDQSLGQSFVYFDPRLEQTQFCMTQVIPCLSQRDSILFSMSTHLLQQYLQAVSHLNFSLETLSYPSLLRLNVSLNNNNPRDGILQIQEVLAGFANRLIPSLTEQEFHLLKLQIQQVVSTQMNNIDHLRDSCRDMFIKHQPNFDENILETITLKEFRQAAQIFQNFSQASLTTNHSSVLDQFEEEL